MADPTGESVTDQANLWVVRVHSGEMSAQDRAEFAAWRADPRHDAAFREAEAAWAATSDLSQDKKTGLARARKARKRRRPGASVILLGAGLAVLVAGWLLSSPRNDYASATGELKEVVLPDGSRVTLNARTAIDLDFSGGRREVTLVRGQAYFEVRPDSSRPFQVAANDARVTVRGTAFDVKHRPDSVEISVLEHSVDVSSSKPGPAAGSTRVDERQQASVVDGRIGNVRPANPDAVLSWRRGELIAEDAELTDVIAELSNYQTGWIVVSDHARSMRVSAVLNLRDAQASLNALAAGLPIQVHRISPVLTIVTAR